MTPLKRAETNSATMNYSLSWFICPLCKHVALERWSMESVAEATNPNQRMQPGR
jgi:hypothetical protein